MKGGQKRRLETSSTSGGIGSFDLTMDLDDADVVNLHGLRFCASIEPENVDANLNGWWAVYCLPGGLIQPGDLPINIGGLGNEDSAPYLWGLGCFTASNQAPYHFEFTPSTSRTCQKGARVLCRIDIEGITAGNARVIRTLTGFTTS